MIVLTCRDCSNSKSVYPSQIGTRYRLPLEEYRCRPCWNSIRRARPVCNRQAVRFQLKCVACGTVSEKKPSEAAPYLDGRAYFCRQCFARKTLGCKKAVICPRCGLERHMKPSQARKSTGYCASCARMGERSGLWNGGKIHLQCSTCGRTSSKSRSAAATRQRDDGRVLCLRCAGKEKKGPANPAWKGGKSFEPYPLTWTQNLRKAIWQRDNNTCQVCLTVKTSERRFAVHHIDYNKENTAATNLILLCNSCHAKTNFKRHTWSAMFNALMGQRALL